MRNWFFHSLIVKQRKVGIYRVIFGWHWSESYWTLSYERKNRIILALFQSTVLSNERKQKWKINGKSRVFTRLLNRLNHLSAQKVGSNWSKVHDLLILKESYISFSPGSYIQHNPLELVEYVLNHCQLVFTLFIPRNIILLPCLFNYCWWSTQRWEAFLSVESMFCSL